MKLIRPLLFLTAFASALGAAPVEIIPPEVHGAVQPQVAVAPSGRTHVVFGKGNAIYHTTSTDGRVFSAPVKVGELEKLALRMRRGPRVTATDKLVLVTAISHADGNLHAWTSADAGATWKENAPLNSTAKSAREGMHSIAGDGRGLVAAVWLDLRGGGMEIRSRVSRDGGATWGEDTSVYQSPDGHVCECCVPTVAISPAGEIAAMWRNWLGGSRDLYLAISRDAGRTFTAAQKLGTGTWKLDGCPMDGGSIAFSPAGNWLTIWRRERAVFSSEAAASEKRLGDNGTQPIAGFAGKSPLLLWESRGALMLQRGNEAPMHFAEPAASASIASGPETATVVWESGAAGVQTILLDRLRQPLP